MSWQECRGVYYCWGVLPRYGTEERAFFDLKDGVEPGGKVFCRDAGGRLLLWSGSCCRVPLTVRTAFKLEEEGRREGEVIGERRKEDVLPRGSANKMEQYIARSRFGVL